MEELTKLFPALAIFMVLGVPTIIFLFRGWMNEKDKRVNDILTLINDFQKTIREVEATHSGKDEKLLEAINGVKSLAEQIKIVVNGGKNV